VGGKPAHLGATLPNVGNGTALAYEVVLTAFLMFVITAAATDTDAVATPSGPSRVQAASVHFTPGARTAWHTHRNRTLPTRDGDWPPGGF
jgi:glycerol uptake facilitator-like aquaporin